MRFTRLMNTPFQLISDGSCDLSPVQLEASGIVVVPFYISLDGKIYQKEIAGHLDRICQGGILHKTVEYMLKHLPKKD